MHNDWEAFAIKSERAITAAKAEEEQLLHPTEDDTEGVTGEDRTIINDSSRRPGLLSQGCTLRVQRALLHHRPIDSIVAHRQSHCPMETRQGQQS